MEITNPKRFNPANPMAKPQPITQTLKIWPEYFNEVITERKKFEIRSTKDRDFMVGDSLNLREFCPAEQDYTGRSCVVKVTYIYEGGNNPFGIPDDVAIMAISVTVRGNLTAKQVEKDDREIIDNNNPDSLTKSNVIKDRHGKPLKGRVS